MSLKSRAGFIWQSHTEPTEVSNGLFAIGWGVWMLMPADSFLTQRQYWFLMRVAPEPVWGAVVLALGLYIVWGVLFGKKTTRRLGMFAVLMLWLYLCASFLVTEPALPSTILFGVMAFKAFWAFLRLK